MGKLVVNGLAASRGYENVNPDLRDIIERAAALSPYDVEVFAGIRYGKAEGSRHNTANAVDVVLRDANGRLIPNYQSAAGFAVYEGFAMLAHQIQQERHPELGDQFRWGGYFGGGTDKYGAVDLMHFELKPGAAMDGGSFEEGLSPEQFEIIKKMGAGLRSSATEKLVPAGPYQKYENLWQSAYRRELSLGLEPALPLPRRNPFIQPDAVSAPDAEEPAKQNASPANGARTPKASTPTGAESHLPSYSEAWLARRDDMARSVPSDARPEEFKPLSRQEFGVRFVGGDSPNREAKGDRLPVAGGGESSSARQKTPPKYYIPIPRPSPLASQPYKRSGLAPGVPAVGKPKPLQAAQDAGDIHEFIMTAARAIVEEKRSRRGPRRSGLGLAGLTKPTPPIG